MAVFRDKKNGSWYVQFRYTDWKGQRQQKMKRGFSTKKGGPELGARVPNEEAGRCGYDLRELCRVVRKEYEAKAEAEYLAQQGTHHQNENSTLFQESKIGRNHFTGCDRMAEKFGS